MRVLFTTYAAASHYFPMVPLGWALRLAGHEVRVAAQPSFAARIAEAGLQPVASGTDADPGAAWLGLDLTVRGDPAGGADERTARTMTMFRLAAEAIVDDVVAIAREWPADLVVFEPREYAGPAAARALGIPSVRLPYGIDHTSPRRGAEWPLLAPLWERLGLTGVDAAGTATLCPCPPSLQIPGLPERWRMRYIPHNGRTHAPAWLHEGGPRVCVTWGTSLAQARGNLEPLEELLRALAGVDGEIVLAVDPAQRELLGDLPPGVRVACGVPLNLLLPTCAAVVHQGGAGTTMTAAACGVPQLVVPVKGDQLVNAERVAARGVGLSVPYPQLDAAEARQAVRVLLSDQSVRRAALEVAAENAAQPSPAEAVTTLTELAGAYAGA
ncbi:MULTISPECIES: nucleotide disphospho-sugar-binding domain-containing protein [unclassified Nonomuraea]|uniref:nucleotide disphospho-sugar-binding domain-containing protein n=1 Tax=unclassified Nonomuraea TaxID=2593643 RepID=UPI0033EF5657